MSSLLKQIEAALVRFQGTLARASMNQQDQVDRLADKTARTLDKMWWNTAAAGIVRGGLKIASASAHIVGTAIKSEHMNNIPSGAATDLKNFMAKEAEAKAEPWAAGAKACDATAEFVDTYFQAQRTGQEKDRELTKNLMDQQAANKSSMYNVEQRANTLEQQFDAHKQSSKQIA
ncbi:MAG: hypothetical protein JSR58_07890 [Verrucomicrobia bacterium]|nr:hypothetical protein [Verrucomicrobiota bacterium]